MEKLIIKEVSPRDGLQTEKPLSPNIREQFIRLLVSSGIKYIEVGSFVNEKKVPQMAGTKDLIIKLDNLINKVNLFALVFVPGQMKQILETNIKEVSLFIGATETFNLKNINCTTFKAMDRVATISKIIQDNNLRVRGYIAMAFGCPYEGLVPMEYVARLIHYYHDLGINEIVLADTIGHADPDSIKAVINEAKKTLDVKNIGLHLHDTVGNAKKNTIAAIEEGVRIFDSAVGGLGGCPFAPGAPGNISTETMLDIASELGLDTGIDRNKLNEAKDYILSELR